MAQQDAWLTYGKNSFGWRYSELAQIHTGNVRRLAPAWVFQTRVPGNLETTPLVVDGLMFVTGGSNHAFALDARTGRSLWQYAKTPPQGLDLCCGEVNRGFAMRGDKLFKVNIEDTLVALDAKSGRALWETQIADYKNSCQRS
jgi:alcohol dehydrogenase (cytochrome c)